MPLVGNRPRRAPKALLLLVIAIGGAVALSGKDVKRYLRMRAM